MMTLTSFFMYVMLAAATLVCGWALQFNAKIAWREIRRVNPNAVILGVTLFTMFASLFIAYMTWREVLS